MAAIQPNSDIVICKGVPLDNGYEHTLYQSTLSSQYTLLSGYAKYTLADYSYQRVNRNMIRVGIKADLLYDCNYMLFRNTAYGSKWFYAFITEINYINDNASEIVYELDVMQTWYFDYELRNCFIEREHTLTDGIDENFEPEENITGDYVTLQQQNLFYRWSDSTLAATTFEIIIYYIPNETLVGCTIDGSGNAVISTTSVPAGTEGGGLWANGQYVPGTYVTIPMMSENRRRTAENVDKVLAALVDANANIYNVALIPTNTHPYFDYNYTLNELNYFRDGNSGAYYYPKNKKLFHYPYKKVCVVNSNGNQKEYKFELFAGTSGAGYKQATFNLSLARIPVSEAFIYPTSYAAMQHNNGLTFNGFPTYTWSVDSFSQWWAQNKTNSIMGSVGSAVTSVAAMLAGGPIGITAGVGMAARSIMSPIQQATAAYNTPDTINGTAASNVTMLAWDRLGFSVYELSIRPEIARTIDDYFSKFGYSCNKLKTPNVRAAAAGSLRPQWNYVKTSTCMCKATDMDAASQRKVEQIYNAGVTFWMTAANVGNYTLDNSARG